MWWWSRISTISACSIPTTLWDSSAWSTSTTLRRSGATRSERLTMFPGGPKDAVDHDRRPVVDLEDLGRDVLEHVVRLGGQRLGVHDPPDRHGELDHPRADVGVQRRDDHVDARRPCRPPPRRPPAACRWAAPAGRTPGRRRRAARPAGRRRPRCRPRRRCPPAPRPPSRAPTAARTRRRRRSRGSRRPARPGTASRCTGRRPGSPTRPGTRGRRAARARARSAPSSTPSSPVTGTRSSPCSAIASPTPRTGSSIPVVTAQGPS